MSNKINDSKLHSNNTSNNPTFQASYHRAIHHVSGYYISNHIIHIHSPSRASVTTYHCAISPFDEDLKWELPLPAAILGMTQTIPFCPHGEINFHIESRHLTSEQSILLVFFNLGTN